MTNSFLITCDVEPFSKLQTIFHQGRHHFRMSDIADLRGSLAFVILGIKVNNDNPILNVLELYNFFCSLFVDSPEPAVLSVDMEPVIYGWRLEDTVLLTKFRSTDETHYDMSNVIGELSYTEVAESLSRTVDSLTVIIEYDPALYAYLLGGNYRN